MEDFKGFEELGLDENFLRDLEPYDINNVEKEVQEPEIENVDSIKTDNGGFKKPPFFKIYSRYFIRPNKDKSQACKIEIYLQYNNDKFFQKGLVVVPVIKFHFGEFKTMLNDINPSFNWFDENIFWIYGWDRVNKFFDVISEGIKNKDEYKDQIVNLNEKIRKSLDFYKPKDTPVIIMSLNKIASKQSVKFSLSPDSIKELLFTKNIMLQMISLVLANKFSNSINGK